MSLRCEIVVEGRLGPRFDGMVGGFDVSTCEQGRTRLSGSVPDRTALREVLTQLDDLGIPLGELDARPFDEDAA